MIKKVTPHYTKTPRQLFLQVGIQSRARLGTTARADFPRARSAQLDIRARLREKHSAQRDGTRRLDGSSATSAVPVILVASVP